MKDTIVEQQNLPLINVAVAVIQREDGHVLMAERPYGKDAAGFWEFPGGKFESGESAEQAITRELYEELGIRLDVAYPWICYKHTYPDKIVTLHVYRVFAWEGTPSGREGQRISWENPSSITVMPLLPANEKILQAIALPSIYAIINAGPGLGIKVKLITRLTYLLEQGIRLMQVRIRHMNPDQYIQIMRPLVNLAHNYGAKVLVNGNESIALKSGADGIHLPADQLMKTHTRPCTQLLSVSCHNASELAHAAALRANFASLSPVRSTPTHPNISGMGWKKFADLTNNLSMPVYALGGLDSSCLATAMRHHAYGIALSSNI
jgi:8-oxo-dGTP diphosphatase